MRETYSYSTRFRKPVGVGNLNFESTALRPLIRSYVRNIEKKTARYEPPKGINKKRIAVPTKDGEIPCYLLEPADIDAALPAILYLHGGGFLFPILHSRLNNAVYYAQKMNCRVLMPEYRLAWDNPFPAAFDDCCAVYEYMLAHTRQLGIAPEKLLIMGDSAGGCLSAGVTLYARDKGISQLRGQLLLYPVTDDRMNDNTLRDYKDAVWTTSSNRHMWSLYTAKGFFDRREYAVPFSNPDLSNLPPAYIEAQEMDCLRQQGVDYGEKLRTFGVKTEIRVIAGSYHGFDVDMKNKTVQRILDERCQVMKQMLSQP